MKKSLYYIFIVSSIIFSIFLVSNNENLDKRILTTSKGTLVPVVDVYKGQKVKQDFISKVDDFEQFNITFGDYDKVFSDEQILISLYANKEKKYQKKFNASDILGTKSISFFLNQKIGNSKNKMFTLEISCESCDVNHKVAIFGSNRRDREYPFFVNNNEISDKTLYIETLGTTHYTSLIIVMIVVSIMFLTCILYDILKNKKCNKSIKNNLLLAIGEFGFSLLIILFLFKIIYIASYKFNIPMLYLFICIILFILLDVIIVYRLINYKKIEDLFITLIIPIGLLYLAFMIPNQVADEPAHYYSAYNVQSGDFLDLNIYTTIPAQIAYNGPGRLQTYSMLNEEIRRKPHYEDTIVATTSRYSSIFYFPSSIAIAINKFLNLPILIGFYGARILTFICYLILTYFAVKMIPFGKLLLLVYLFNPMQIHQSISLSADSLMNASILLYLAYILKLLHKKGDIKKREIFLLIILNFVVALNKYVYLPLVLLSLLLLFKPNISKSKKTKLILSVIFSVIICMGLFLYTTIIDKPAGNEYIISTGVDMIKQTKFFIKDPINLIKMFHITFTNNGEGYIRQFLGGSLSWLNLPVNFIVIITYLITLVMSIFAFSDKDEPTKIERIVFSIINIGIVLLIVLAMNLTWTRVGTLVTDGVQGRYFYPVILPILLMLIKKNRNMAINNCYLKFCMAILFVNFCTILTIIYHFI